MTSWPMMVTTTTLSGSSKISIIRMCSDVRAVKRFLWPMMMPGTVSSRTMFLVHIPMSSSPFRRKRCCSLEVWSTTASRWATFPARRVQQKVTACVASPRRRSTTLCLCLLQARCRPHTTGTATASRVTSCVWKICQQCPWCISLKPSWTIARSLTMTIIFFITTCILLWQEI